MKASKDFYYYNSNILRFLMLQKSTNFNNSFSITSFDKLVLYFSILNINDLDDLSLFNYLYFFRFFLGVNAYFTKIQINYKLGVTTYSIRVKIILLNRDIYSFLSFFLNDIVFSSELEHLFNFSKRFRIYSLCLPTLVFFSEKKTNVGLLDLTVSLNLKFFFNGFDNGNFILFLKNLKINLV